MKKKAVPSLLLAIVLIIFTLALFKNEISEWFADSEQTAGAQSVRITCPGSVAVVANPTARVNIPDRCQFETTVQTVTDVNRFRTQTFPDEKTYGPGALPRPYKYKNPVGSVEFISVDGKPVQITVHLKPASY